MRHHLGAIIGCHLFAATSESLGYLDPSGEGQVSRSEWGNSAVVSFFLVLKDRTGQITLETKIYPKTSWKLEDDPF